MLQETSLCMGCMNDKTYDGPCKLCGYSEDTPYIPSYLAPKTLLNERYIIGKVISYNGEGAVYIGFDTATGTRVTVKEYMPDTLCKRKKGEEAVTVIPEMLPLYKTYLSEFIDLNRTLMKSRGMAHLQTVLDVFTENNTAYVVFEYINGISLKTYLANSAGSMTWEQAKELFPPIFTTLSLVHAECMVHRGISPSTIFVTDKMELKLAGFSIAAARTTKTEIACEVFAGYAAPEQYVTNGANGTWTDVYGIAAVLYRALTGCVPAESIARTEGSLLEPMMINRNIPQNVSAAIMQGMALSTDNRIQTITGFVEELFRQPAPEQEKQLSQKQLKRMKKQRKERAKTIAVLVIAGIVLIGFAIVFVQTLKNPVIATPPEPEQTTASTTATTASQTSASSAESEPAESVPVDSPSITMPDFTNRRYETTVTRYEGFFTFIPTYEYSDDYSAGMMYDQSIEPGTMVTEGTQIEIKVSKGRSIVPLPEYEGSTLEDYIKVLDQLNIKYSVKPERTNETAQGNVSRCSKEPGDLVNVEEGEIITVLVAENYTEEPQPEQPETVEPEQTNPEDNGGIPVESAPEEE
ncbi:MAG: PASTA domain-containing protein [Oscillospiraceae bacterium]